MWSSLGAIIQPTISAQHIHHHQGMESHTQTLGDWSKDEAQNSPSWPGWKKDRPSSSKPEEMGPLATSLFIPSQRCQLFSRLLSSPCQFYPRKTSILPAASYNEHQRERLLTLGACGLAPPPPSLRLSLPFLFSVSFGKTFLLPALC